jgi:hypothetical protein
LEWWGRGVGFISVEVILLRISKVKYQKIIRDFELKAP